MIIQKMIPGPYRPCNTENPCHNDNSRQYCYHNILPYYPASSYRSFTHCLYNSLSSYIPNIPFYIIMKEQLRFFIWFSIFY